MKRSPLIDLSEIHCLDVHELDTFSGLPPEAWKAILSASMSPFPIVTFKENGVWRAFNARADAIRGWPRLGATVTVEMVRELTSAAKIEIRTAPSQFSPPRLSSFALRAELVGTTR